MMYTEPERFIVEVTLFENGTYLMLQDEANETVNGEVIGTAGIERGTYSWDSQTGAFSATPVTDTNLQWGFSHDGEGITVNVDATHLTMHNPNEGEGGEDYVLSRVPYAENSIVGSWFVGVENEFIVQMTFFSDGTYLFLQDEADELSGGELIGTAGLETGTYTWNGQTSAFTTTAITDTNLQWGFSHDGGGITVTIGGTGLNMYNPTEDTTYTLTRVPEPVF